ncbi:MAG: ABC transporter ATP-binding protein [Candidatus Edwardsbacteria bacterium]|nr:ABC transporter ATP-binding protein [Candidatus Edwardsbacteria bacterium]
MLKVSELQVSYGSLEVLHGITFRVDPGEIVAVLGSKGAGKSTAISAVSGILPVRGGKIEFSGQEINGRPADDIVGMGLVQVPEGRRIFPGLTVLENLDLGAYLISDKKQKQESLGKVLDIFPKLRERKGQKGGTLSGGEQQMLAIARGLMAAPKMLLLDEPSLGLAPIIVDRIFQVIQNIRQSGTTILLVEQNAQRSLEIADRGYILETGNIVLEGAGRALLNNEKVKASYLGA